MLITLQPESSNIDFIYHVETRKFSFVNAQIQAVLGLTNDDADPKSLFGLIYPDDKDFILKSANRLVQEKGAPFVDFRLRIEDTERWFRCFSLILRSGDEKVVAGTLTEITSERENLTSIERFANKKNSILQILSHDLRGPLGAANMAAQLARRENSQQPLENFLVTISRTIQQSIALIKDLTAREFLETIEAPLVKKRIDIATKIREYVRELINSDQPARRNFTFESSEEQIHIPLDEAKFMQIMNNLVTNALKFTVDGGNIGIKVNALGGSVLLTFSDDGIGIPDALKPEIFKQDSRAGREGLQGEPSTGMGLYIVKTIVEWHNGTITFESAEGEGTTFFITIPVEYPNSK